MSEGWEAFVLCARSLGVIGECNPLARYAIACELGPSTPAPRQAVLPAEFAGRPHDYLKELNGGSLPYVKNRKSARLAHPGSCRLFDPHASLLSVPRA